MNRRGAKGQALVEWLIFGSVALTLWFAAFSAAKTWHERVVAQIWARLGARQALSNARAASAPGVSARLRMGDRNGAAEVVYGNASAEAALRLPEPRKDRFSFGFSSCGVPCVFSLP